MKYGTEKLEDLGFDDFFVSNRQKLKLDGFSAARVIAEHKGAYKVKNTQGEYLAKVTGRQMFQASSREDYPAVGDWVAITQLDKERAVICGILPRKTVLKRKASGKNEAQVIAANIDVAFVIESVDRDYNLNRFERYFAMANGGGLASVIVLNKADLIPKEDLHSRLAQIRARLPGVEVISTSTITEEGVSELKGRIVRGKTYCFLGSSGVGKSSLINKLIGEDAIKTEAISPAASRGKHVTTSREMYFLENGGLVIDNPGMREVGLAGAKEGIDNVFDAVVGLARKCKYTDCTHTHEPGCEVLSAVASGKLDESKYSNYLNLKKEAEYYAMTELEKKQKDRRFGKFVKKAKEDLRNYGYKN